MPEYIIEERPEVPWHDAALRLYTAPFYGQNPPLEEVNQLRCLLLLMYGRDDPYIMPGLPALLGALQQAERPYELHVYEQAGHDFLNDTRPESYQQEAAADAWTQLLRFFARHLH